MLRPVANFEEFSVEKVHLMCQLFEEWKAPAIRSMGNGAELSPCKFFKKKKSSSTNEYTNLSKLGLWKSSCNLLETNAPTSSNYLVRILFRWRDWAVLFEDETEIAVTVNGIRCRNMITEFLWPQVDVMDLGDMWFQQDGATCHTAHETIDLLQQRFPEQIISRNSDVNWPPSLCDLTMCDFFL